MVGRNKTTQSMFGASKPVVSTLTLTRYFSGLRANSSPADSWRKQRKTNKMIERDLMAARDKWLDEAETEDERKQRLESDFLCHVNHDGLYADFHSLRHWFITGLARAGVSPKMAQTLARHSDIRLTLGVYTHVELPDRSAAICALPGPPHGKQGVTGPSKEKSVA